jgi:hypothetical protein
MEEHGIKKTNGITFPRFPRKVALSDHTFTKRLLGIMEGAASLLDEILSLSDTSPTPGQHRGIPLYRYRIDDGHRERMREVLCVHGAQRKPIDDATAALFCRYAADVFRRYEGAKLWTWATVTEPIGWGGDYLELVSAVERGLAWWKRPLFITRNGRRFLATLVKEGGGPLGLLRAQHNSRFRNFLRRLLADREHFQRSALHMVDHHRDQLPSSLQQDDLLNLLAELVDNVAILRATLRRDGVDVGASDPIAALDRSDPQWRDRLVLDLDDGLACELLQGLLCQPAPIQRNTRAVPTVETLLWEVNDGFSLRREVLLPDEPDAGEFLRVFGYEGEAPGRIRVLRERSDGICTDVATATVRQNESKSYVFERSPGARIDDPAELCEPVTLVLRAGTRELGRFSPPGGEALGKGPWTFAASVPHPLLAEGSLQTRHPSVWVALPGTEAVVSEGSEWRALGSLRLPDELRTLWHLEGRVTIPLHGEHTEITTGVPAEDDRWYVQGSFWMGPGHFRITTFRGLPTVHRLDREGVSHPVSSDQISWKGPGGPQHPCGHGVLEVKHKGRLRLRAPMVIVPPDLTVKLQAARAPHAGTLCIRCREVTDVGLDPDPQLTVTSYHAGDVHKLEVERSPESALDTLTLTIRLKGGVDLRLHVDFPARRKGFVRGFDTVLPAGEKCSLEQLARIRAVASSHQHHERFELVARVPQKTPWQRLATLPALDGRRELVLDAVRDELAALLAYTTEIDGTVELGIECLGEAPGKGLFNVCRYDRWFDVEQTPEGRILRLSQSNAVTPFAPESLRVEARPLLEPQAEARLLQPIDGCWHLTRSQGFAPGRWMVLAWRHDHLAVRPLCATVPASASQTFPAPSSGLRAAASHDDATKRAAALDHELARLVDTPFDPEWRWIDDHLATLYALPASTFDVVHALVRDPKVAIVSFLRAPKEIRWKVWEALETLPFLWETVPVADWAYVLQRMRDAWSQHTGAHDGEGFDDFFNQLVQETNHARMTLRTQLELAAARIDQPVPQGTLERARNNPASCAWLRTRLEEDAIQLRQRHDPASECWPDDDLQEVLAALPNSERLEGHNDFQELVVHGPLIAACWSAGRLTCFDGDEHAPGKWARLRLDLRRARSFDRMWFDEATAFWLARLFLCAPGSRSALEVRCS